MKAENKIFYYKHIMLRYFIYVPTTMQYKVILYNLLTNSEVLFLKEVFFMGGLMLVIIGAVSSGKWLVTRPETESRVSFPSLQNYF